MFDESKHPRDTAGKFTSTDGAGGTHEATPAEEKRLKELGIISPIKLSKQEWAVLRAEVMRKNLAQKGKGKPINFAYTSNYFYIYKTNGDDGFIPFIQLDIEYDEEKINDYLSYFKE